MNVLVINAGSSSLKYQFLNVDTHEVYAKGNCERIGIADSFIGHTEGNADKQKLVCDLPDHKTAIQEVFKLLESIDAPVDAIGHRVVQGGWYFGDSFVVNDETLAKIREVSPLAPLHNPAEADVIEICRDLYPSVPNVAVPDSAFHFNMPERASRYALPREVCDELHIRKYGAHGTSHRYIWREASRFVGDACHKLISCHLGSGASLCAIKDGQSQDTTMGLTPLDGLIMGTRCGTIDPATVCYLQREGQYSFDEVDAMMNKKSGLLALTDGYNDARDIEMRADAGDEKCKLALEMFTYRAAQLICEMAQSLEGFDTLVFTAGIGENSDLVRSMIADKLAWLGVKIDADKNSIRSDEVREISTPDSSCHVLIVPTDEEYMIALDAKRLLG